MPTTIKPCTCTHAYQDGKYGAGKRVFNETKKGNKDGRCTVCKSMHAGKAPEKVEKKADKTEKKA